MRCPKCGYELSNDKIVILDRESVRVIASNARKLELYLGNTLGEKVKAKP